MNTQKELVVMLCFEFVFASTGLSDVGADVLASLTNGNRESMRRIDVCVSPAAREVNCVAQAVADEAEIALGQEKRYFGFIPPSGILYNDTVKDWLVVVEEKAAD